MKLYRIVFLSIVCLAGLAVLAACGAGSAPGAETLVPTVDVQQATAAPGGAQPGGLNGYPAPGLDSQPPSAAYPEPGGYPPPGGGAPQGVPAVENMSKVTAKLISLAPSEANPAQTKLHAQVLASNDVEGMQNLTRELVDKEADLVIDTSLLPAELQPGDTFEATISYRGDENGGIYLVQSLSEAAQ